MFDFIIIIFWWFIMFILGIIFLPLTFQIFKPFFDNGYPFSKLISLAIISYIIWILGEAKILQFSLLNIQIVAAITLVLNFLIMKKTEKEFLFNLRSKYKIFIAEEILFLIALIVWSMIRGFEPRIEGLEKFMDFGFVNSILRTEYFPPKDMWLAGSNINYYYFGHLMTAVLTKFSGIPATITYNLMIASIFALSFVSSFSLASNIIYAYFEGMKEHFIALGKENFHKIMKNIYLAMGGLISAIAVTVAGNLQPLYYYLTNNYSFENYWYPTATRFIPFTIHEFPMYTFVVADLHAFLIDTPFVVLVIAVIFVLFKENFKIKISKNIKDYFLPVFLGFALSITYMTNMSDWMIYVLFLGIVTALAYYFLHKISIQSFKNYLFFLFVVVGSSFIFSFPFFWEFTPFVKGVALVTSHSAFSQLLVLWGFYLFIVISFIFLLGYLCLKKENITTNKEDSIKNIIAKKISPIDIFVVALMFFSLILIISPEVFYIKDIYANDYYRANTMFKLVYQAWIMLGVSTGYVFCRFIVSFKLKFIAGWIILFYLLFICILLFPKFAINSYYNNLEKYNGLMGLDWLQNLFPDDYAAIKWLNQHIKGQPVIVEGVDEDFTFYGRISANTGLINIVNWASHEWLWRGSYDEAGKRKEEVRKIYESQDIEDVKTLLKKYNVEYIYVGSLEIKKYPQLNEGNFGVIGEAVFVSGQTKIYRVEK